MTFTASEVARYFLAVQDENAGELITNLKLQKLLYYAQGYHLALYGRPLFDDPLEAWEHGPVVGSIYREYKLFRDQPIVVPAEVPEGLSDEAKTVLDDVYAAYGRFTAVRLLQITHQEQLWKQAKRGMVSIIDTAAMEREFRARLAAPRPRLTWKDALANPRFDAAIDRGLAEVEADRVIPWSEVERSLPS